MSPTTSECRSIAVRQLELMKKFEKARKTKKNHIKLKIDPDVKQQMMYERMADTFRTNRSRIKPPRSVTSADKIGYGEF